jgi:hypothetical protein
MWPVCSRVFFSRASDLGDSGTIELSSALARAISSRSAAAALFHS